MRALTSGLIVVSVLAVVGAQAPRDQGAPVSMGTGSVAGRVVTDEASPTPVRRATVTLTGEGLRPRRGAITDDLGRFVISGLPAGRFTLTASRPSFITSEYGARRPGRPGTPLVVGAGQAVSDLTVRLWRGAAIAGVLRDETGLPAQGVPVRAVPARPFDTSLTLTNNGGVTNDLGEFRIFGLPPGVYAVSAEPEAGQLPPIHALNDAAVDAVFEGLRRGTSRGAPAPAARPSVAITSKQPFEYAAIYHPGTPSAAQASPVTVAAGQELVGLDFALQRVLTAFIEGLVTRSDGQPGAAATVQLTEVASPGPFAPTAQRLLRATAGGDGRFRFERVTPGTYRILARAAAPVSAAPSATPSLVAASGFRGPAVWATADIAMAGNDLTNLSLTLQPGRALSGRIVFDGASRPTPAVADVRVSLTPSAVFDLLDGSTNQSIQSWEAANARDDGTFELSGISPGRYVLQIGSAAAGKAGWWAQSARIGDRDLLDGFVDVDPSADLSGVVVTFADRRTEINGRLQTSSGAPVTEVFVIAFAADSRYWGHGSRRVQVVRPGVDGRFAIAGLPPGEYRLAAATDVERDESEDPAFLALALPASLPLSLAAGETRTQDLRVGGP